MEEFGCRLFSLLTAVERGVPGSQGNALTRRRPFRDAPTGQAPEPMNTRPIHSAHGPWSWVPGARASPAPRNDNELSSGTNAAAGSRNLGPAGNPAGRKWGG